MNSQGKPVKNRPFPEAGPRVSVLIPTYNSERYLAECLESVMTQDFKDIEILISDDCSTDGTLKIIQDHAARDGRIRWWRNPRNLGLYPNHNVCLNEARGKYIKFVHADDKLLSNSAVTRMVAALESHPSAVLAGSQQHLTGARSRPTIFSRKSGVYNGKKMIMTCLEHDTNLIGQPTLTLFRKDMAKRGFDERFTGLGDFEMWCHLLEQGDFAYLAEPLATWRVHETQQTARHQTSGSSRHEHLQFMEIYFVRPWMQKAATSRLLFTQIYYLRKQYGRSADGLTCKMMAGLTPPHYAWQWLKHKTLKPLKNLSRELDRLKHMTFFLL